MEDRAHPVVPCTLLYGRRRRHGDRHESATSRRVRWRAAGSQQNLDRTGPPAAPEAKAETGSSSADNYPKLAKPAVSFQSEMRLIYTSPVRSPQLSYLSI